MFLRSWFVSKTNLAAKYLALRHPTCETQQREYSSSLGEFNFETQRGVYIDNSMHAVLNRQNVR